MRLTRIILSGFKSFSKKTTIDVSRDITGIVGPNGSGKSNVAEAIRFVLGEQSMKTMRGKLGTDLIFKGSSVLSPLARAHVAMVLDAKEKPVHTTHNPALASFLVYDEITLTREVFADGGSDYTINGSKVRLKDVQELLALAGIGVSKHTILNQGEADRVLLLDPRERRELIEDALGLRVYQIRLKESERKLNKTEVYIKEVKLLESEIAPRLSHLQRLVEKIEKTKIEREKYSSFLHSYLYIENARISEEEKLLDKIGSSYALSIILDSVEKEILLYENEVEGEKQDNQGKELFLEKIKDVDTKRNNISRELGHLEAERGYLDREIERGSKEKEVVLPSSMLMVHKKKVVGVLDSATEAVKDERFDDAFSSIKEARDAENSFAEEKLQKYNIEEKMRELSLLYKKIEEKEQEEKKLTGTLVLLQEQIDKEEERKEKEKEKVFEKEKHMLTLKSKVIELAGLVRLQKEKENTLNNDKQFLETLTEEGKILIGPSVHEFAKTHTDKHIELGRNELMRAIERCKLKIEESGVIAQEEVMKEYESVILRSKYLENELEDVRRGREDLLKLIHELEEHIKEEFKVGLSAISRLFNEYFKQVFDGGKASLTIVKYSKDENEDYKEEEDDKNGKDILGVDIDVDLPEKKVKTLALLSGGEKALTSIALLFAMASISPPPFIVLDETDAPLDEHNAKKYGEMLAHLAEKSKLLVITHNRETMSHCHMLYGVTLGVDGSSKLLSIELKG